jgi:DNA-binding XRE family transcriptional regulator
VFLIVTDADTGYIQMIMHNNLQAMIARSGMSKREVAAIKGVTPETLSRHISGKIGISLNDAEMYAKILGCTAQEVFFASAPIDIIGTNTLLAKAPTDAPGEARFKWTRQLTDDRKQYFPLGLTSGLEGVGAWHTAIDKTYSGRFQFMQNIIELVLLEPIEKQYASPQQCAGRLCYVEFSDEHTSEEIANITCDVETTKIVQALVYPNPDGTYTLVNVFGLGNIENKFLKWATPVLGANMLPTQGVNDVLGGAHGRMGNFS